MHLDYPNIPTVLLLYLQKKMMKKNTTTTMKQIKNTQRTYIHNHRYMYFVFVIGWIIILQNIRIHWIDRLVPIHFHLSDSLIFSHRCDILNQQSIINSQFQHNSIYMYRWIFMITFSGFNLLFPFFSSIMQYVIEPS